MKISREEFATIVRKLGKNSDYVYDNNSQLYLADNKKYKAFSEETARGNRPAYIIFASVKDVTLPLELDMIETLIKDNELSGKGGREKLIELKEKKIITEDLVNNAIKEDPIAKLTLGLHLNGFTYFCNRPAEVLAKKQKKEGKREKWDYIAMRIRKQANCFLNHNHGDLYDKFCAK